MQIGDVDFDTAATDDYNFVFVGVADPGDVVHASTRRPAPAPPARHGLGEAQPPEQPGLAATPSLVPHRGPSSEQADSSGPAGALRCAA